MSMVERDHIHASRDISRPRMAARTLTNCVTLDCSSRVDRLVSSDG